MNVFPGAVQYPVGKHSIRRFKPVALLVVHITGNSALPSALAEAKYSNRVGSGASFGFVTDRDGSIVQCMDPATAISWTTGSLNQPNTTLASIRAMIGSAYGPNFWVYAQCENVGYEPGNPITAKQIATLARLAVWLHKLSGLPINRDTVLGHRDFNNVARHNCPTSGDLNALLNKVIAAANAILVPPVVVKYANVDSGSRIRSAATASSTLVATLAATTKMVFNGTVTGASYQYGAGLTGTSWSKVIYNGVDSFVITPFAHPL